MSMRSESVWMLAGVAVAATLLTGYFRWVALRRGLIDVPNGRSSHTVPTPRGGGLAIVVVILAALPFMGWLAEAVPGYIVFCAAVLGGLVAAVGYWDDHRHVPASIRLSVHLAAIFASLLIIRQQGNDFGDLTNIGPAWVSILVLTLACAWFLNLFNFMDGIDGIAACQAIFMSIAAAYFCATRSESVHLVVLWLVVAAACCGFLFWNWAPARIFMGDVGSGYLGYLISVLLIYSVTSAAISAGTAVILGATFIADATVTLLRRVAAGQSWYTAHRSHAYQRMARRWRSHAAVTTAFAAVNALVVFPLAAWAQSDPVRAPAICVSLLVVLSCVCWFVGAGKPDELTARESSN